MTFLSDSVPGVQSALTEHAREANATRVRNGIANPQSRAEFMSTGKEGLAWLTAHPNNIPSSCRMDDELAVIAFSVILGIAVLQAPNADLVCPCCSVHVLSSTLTGGHALSCSQTGAGGLKARQSTRHAQFLRTLLRTLRLLDRMYRNATFTSEPGLRYIPGWTAKKVSVEGARGDLSVELQDSPLPTMVLDLVISHPSVGATPACATTAGLTAARAHDRKVKSYNDGWTFPKHAFAPISVETGGRWHPSARKTLALITRHIICGKKADDEDMSPEEKRKYAIAMRTLIVATSAQLARSTAAAIYSLACACKRGPVAAPVVAQAAAAAPLVE